MGRPPLGVKPTVVRLTEEVRQRITALVGTSGMARFIREAVDAELARREAASSKPCRKSKSACAKEAGAQSGTRKGKG